MESILVISSKQFEILFIGEFIILFGSTFFLLRKATVRASMLWTIRIAFLESLGFFLFASYGVWRANEASSLFLRRLPCFACLGASYSVRFTNVSFLCFFIVAGCCLFFLRDRLKQH